MFRRCGVYASANEQPFLILASLFLKSFSYRPSTTPWCHRTYTGAARRETLCTHSYVRQGRPRQKIEEPARQSEYGLLLSIQRFTGCPMFATVPSSLTWGVSLRPGDRTLSLRHPINPPPASSSGFPPQHEATDSITLAPTPNFFLAFSAQKRHVKPPNHLTQTNRTRSSWHFSYPQSAILDI